MNIIQGNILLKKRKKQRIKISKLNDFIDALKNEGYEVFEFDKEEIAKIFNVDISVIEGLYTCISDAEITYKANDINDFIDYIEKIILFESEHNKLCEKISKIKTLIIDRIEYEREPRFQENVENIISTIEKVANEVSCKIDEEDKIKIEELEKEIGKDYVYAKDIELLKKILIREEEIEETYNIGSKTKTIYIKVPEKINYEYIKAKKGTVQYHEYLSKNIPRIQRLLKNINKYIKIYEKDKTMFRINQSEALQDSINIALAIYDNTEFRAISGSDEIKNFCKSPPLEEAIFESRKVNKLGKLGIGYNRVNDSEKKIFEEIHKQIEEKALKNEGNIVLYSKWEPCPSCYLVIHQFQEKHPNIKVQVRYIKKYGEK